MNQVPPNSFYSSSSGNSSTGPFVEFFSTVDPTIYDVNFPIQKRWLNVITGIEFILVSFNSTGGSLLADWYQLNGNGGESGGLTWVTVSTNTIMDVNFGYVVNGNVIFTLPGSAIVGDIIRVVGVSGSSRISQNINQQIILGDKATTISTGGYLQSKKPTDCIELICTSPGTSTVFSSGSVQGNWTLV